MGAAGTAAVLLLACVLVAAALGKLGGAMTVLGAGELALAGAVVVLPGRVAGGLLTIVFAAFTLTHLGRLRAGRSDCGCLGDGPAQPIGEVAAGVLTALSAAAAAAVAAAGAPNVVDLAARNPGALPMVVAAALAGASLWMHAFTAERGAVDRAARALVDTSASFLERRVSRRTALQQLALVGSALAVAPLRYLLYPGTALAAISPGACGGGLCTDGYTGFCCELPGAQNTCPAGTFAGGWWMCTDYAGRRLCSEQGVRYYVDCNALPGHEFPGGCQCGGGSCANRRVACNVFRYGQCNTHVAGVTAVVCRMVVCENPSRIPGLNCGGSLAVDDAVCGQDVPCLSFATELAGAGGV
jgi:hypothetical protein